MLTLREVPVDKSKVISVISDAETLAGLSDCDA